jgi:GTPase
LVSAATGQGIEGLLTAVEAVMVQTMKPFKVQLPYKRGDLLSLIYERGQVDSESHLGDGVVLHGRLPARLHAYLQPYLVS